MVRAGPLRDRVEVQNFVVTRDATGGIVRTHQTVCEVWGSITPLRGEEREFGDTQESRATHKVTIRNFEGLDTKYRFLFGTRKFNIVEIIDVNNRHRLHQVLVKEDV